MNGTEQRRRVGLVSFVVPVWNEEAHLTVTLEAIRRAASGLGVGFEIVVADDGSTDGSAEVAARWADRVVRVEHRQISATRNAGAREARGDVLVFVDADTVVGPGVLESMLEAVRGGAVGGGCQVRFDDPVPFWAGSVAGVMNVFCRCLRLAYGCFLFCTREGFEAVGGFDSKMYVAEEVAMSRALKRVGRFVVVREKVTTSGRKLRDHTFREALGMSWRALVSGVRTRKGKELWYGARLRGASNKEE